MHFTELLSMEHRVIEQVLNCLAAIVERGESNRQFDWESAELVIDFLRNYADECHHAKEEDKLFPVMEQRGFSPDVGPTAVMRHDHEEGRGHIAAMTAAVEAGLRGDNSLALQFGRHSQTYIDLLRNHIQKEDHCLFPLADHVLTELDQQRLLCDFEDIDETPTRAGRHDHYLQLAKTLADRFDKGHSGESSLAAQSCSRRVK